MIGAVRIVPDFPAAPILLGHVPGPMVEENFRRVLLVLLQLFFWLRGRAPLAWTSAGPHPGLPPYPMMRSE